jgi:hypothetical protein
MTGYTYPVADGKITTFADFAAYCAKAFLRHMEDAKPGDPITLPDLQTRMPEYRYLEEKHYAAATELEAIRKASSGDLEAIADRAHAEQMAFHQQRLDWRQKNIENNAKLIAIATEVTAWTPPTPEHEEFKKFMLGQIKTSVETIEEPPPSPIRKSTTEVIADRVCQLEHDRAYWSRVMQTQKDGYVKAFKWARALRGSLRQADQPATVEATR